MIPRYDLIIDIHLTDDAAMMREHSEGDYVLYSDHKAKKDLAIDVLTSLKLVNLNNTSANELNTIVSQAIEALND